MSCHLGASKISRIAQKVLKGENMTEERSAIDQEHTWDLKILYQDLKDWESAFDGVKNKFCSDIQALKGKLGDGSVKVKKLFESTYELEKELMNLYTYAHLRHDEDISHEDHKSAYDRISALLYQFSEATSWIEPELLALPAEKLEKLLQCPELADYKMVIEKCVRLKPHTLSAREEELLALSGKGLECSEKAFGALNNADLKFPDVKDGKGETHKLSHGLFQAHLRSPDRTLRENAYKAFQGTFLNFENTLCELLNGKVQAHIFNAKARSYTSCLQAALFPHNIDTAVYDALINATHQNIKQLHRFVSLRKKLMKLDSFHAYDFYAPATDDLEMKFDYETAVDLTLEAVEPLGPSYCEVLKRGLKQERWVDIYENARKRSGAYSSGCYESYPYILLNYQGFLNDVMTLAHEAGHSMHTYFSNQSQAYHDSHYSIFVAEVASTFNEELLFRHLLQKTKTKKERIFLLLQKLDGIRATFFRQVLFAEFEKQVHELAEKGAPLTPATLKKTYRELNVKYFGPDFANDEELDIEFARVPHFYYNFYVYQYATGISAAFALVEQVLKEGPKRYLEFLSAGGSDYPVEVLKRAGVDMCTPAPVDALLHRFGALMDELEAEL